MPARERSPRVRWAMALAAALLVVLPGAPASSEPRLPVGCCDLTGTYKVRFTVKLDPANHNAVIRLTTGTVVVVRLDTGRFEIRGNRSEIIRAMSDRLDCGLPLAVGAGTVAGFPGVDGRYKDVVVADDNIQGLLELGTGGELPTGQAVCYEFTGERDPDVPDSGDANVDFILRYSLGIAGLVTIGEGFIGALGVLVDADTFVVGDHVFAGDGTGGFTPIQQLPISRNPIGLVPARLDGDAFADFAVATTNPQAGDSWLLAFRQTSLGTFTQTANVDLGLDLASISVGDVNGDSFDDVVKLGAVGEIQVLRNTGNGTFGSSTLQDGVNFVASARYTGDLDGDDDQDVAAIGWSEVNPANFAIKPLFGDGSGGFTVASTETQLPGCAGNTAPGQVAAEIVDLDGDGFRDVVVVNAGGGECPGTPSTVTVLLNRANQPGVFTGLPPFEVQDLPSGGATLQVYRPLCGGTPALIANGQIFTGLGDGRFVDTGVNFNADGGAPVSTAVGDVNGDGVAEVTAVYDEDEDGPIIRIHSIVVFAERPAITSVSVAGKNLAVGGTGFVAGSKILVDGVEYKTKIDRADPTMRLLSKKALKKIEQGESVLVQVRTPSGVVSEGFVFTR